MAKVYAFVADGMEEVECLAVGDCLRRAKVDVKLVSIMGRKMEMGSHGFKIEACSRKSRTMLTYCSFRADLPERTI